jgi:hypothetical protein
MGEWYARRQTVSRKRCQEPLRILILIPGDSERHEMVPDTIVRLRLPACEESDPKCLIARPVSHFILGREPA